MVTLSLSVFLGSHHLTLSLQTVEGSIWKSRLRPCYELPTKHDSCYLIISHRYTHLRPLLRKAAGMTSQNPGSKGLTNRSPTGVPPSQLFLALPSRHRALSPDADLASSSLSESDPRWGEPLSAAPNYVITIIKELKRGAGRTRHRWNCRLIVIDVFLLAPQCYLSGWQEQPVSCNTTDYLSSQP